MKELCIRRIRNRRELDKLLRIREAVFIREQNVPRARELDMLEDEARHFIVFLKGKCVGGARVRFVGKRAKLERVVFRKAYRGRGFGKALMRHLIAYAKRMGVKEIYVHGQVRTRKFYEDAGFKKRGSIFMDGGMRHYEFYMKTKGS